MGEGIPEPPSVELLAFPLPSYPLADMDASEWQARQGELA